LYALINQITDDPDSLKKRFQQERAAWVLFYKILDVVEEKLKAGNSFAGEIQIKALSLVTDCKI
jgi:hypothetical protein